MKAAKIFGTLAGAVLLYVLSIGPANVIYFRAAYQADRFYPIYDPVVWVAGQWMPLWHALEAYAGWWHSVLDAPSEGNPN